MRCVCVGREVLSHDATRICHVCAPPLSPGVVGCVMRGVRSSTTFSLARRITFSRKRSSDGGETNATCAESSAKELMTSSVA